MPNKSTSIRRRLISRITGLLSIFFAVNLFILSTVFYLMELRQRTSAHQEALEGFIRRGLSDVAKGSISLQGLAEDYAFTTISELLRASLAQDSDMMYALFMDRDRKIWSTGVLHNVGNVLNSINVTSEDLVRRIAASRVATLHRAAQVLHDHRDDAADYMLRHEQGRKLPGFLMALAEHLLDEQKGQLEALERLSGHVQHIIRIISLQQEYGRSSSLVERSDIKEAVEHVCLLNETAMQRHDIRFIREYDPLPPVLVDRHKLMQILVNLIKNAREALAGVNRPDREVRVTARKIAPDRFAVEVSDNGPGIAPDDLVRVFSHGFTTKKNGHGFGLHSCAIAAREMDGTITCRSDGPGTGTLFSLVLPLRTENET